MPTPPPWYVRLALAAAGYARWHRVDSEDDVIALVKRRDDAIAIGQYPNVVIAARKLVEEVDSAGEVAWPGLRAAAAGVRTAAARAMGRS